MGHNHNTTSNTDKVFRTFIGCRVRGMVSKITSNGEHADILVFDCGWGLAFNSNGSHWTENPEDIKRFINRAREELDNNQRELKHILKLAGK